MKGDRGWVFEVQQQVNMFARPTMILCLGTHYWVLALFSTFTTL